MLILLISFAIVVTFIGAIYQYWAQSVDEKLAPGKLIKVGSHQFHLFCQGHGSPTVILESGHLHDYSVWLNVMDLIKSTTRVCSYDRLGIGWSSANDKPTRSVDVANNLHSLLLKADIKFPVILAGWSAGGIYIRKYYELFPDTVAGLIFIESSHEQQDLFKTERAWQKVDYYSSWGLCFLISWTGFLRVISYHKKKVPKSLSEPQYKEKLSMFNRTGFCSGRLYENGFELDATSDTPPRPVGDLPIIVIRGGDYNLEDLSPEMTDYVVNTWPRLQAELAALSSNSISMVAEKSDHGVPFHQPDIIAKAIEMMVSQVRGQ